jgi:hypothetical protein
MCKIHQNQAKRCTAPKKNGNKCSFDAKIDGICGIHYRYLHLKGTSPPQKKVSPLKQMDLKNHAYKAFVENTDKETKCIKFKGENDDLLTRRDFCNELYNNVNFRTTLIETLEKVEFPAFFWECVPMVDLNEPFECTVMRSKALEKIKPDKTKFAEYFTPKKCENGIVKFLNPAQDTVLIVPCPIVEKTKNFSSLSTFLRDASPALKDDLFREVGRVMCVYAIEKSLPMCLSTSGLQVSWLHVRIGTAPKNYGHQTYVREHKEFAEEEDIGYKFTQAEDVEVLNLGK